MNTRLTLLAIATSIAMAGNAHAQNQLPSAGNVGIGTLRPEAALDVRGSAKVAGDIMLGDEGRSTRGLIAYGRLDLSSGGNEDIYLNRRSGARDVYVGEPGHISNLNVSGKTTTTTIELTSDRHQKTGFRSVAQGDVLSRLATLPISTWVYTNSPGTRHLGPTAQDFKSAFPEIGDDDRHIGAGDGIGVALAAIRDLHEVVRRQEAELRSLRRDLVEARRSTALSGNPAPARDEQPSGLPLFPVSDVEGLLSAGTGEGGVSHADSSFAGR